MRGSRKHNQSFEAFCLASNQADAKRTKSFQTKLAPATWTATITNLNYPETVFCRNRNVAVDKLKWQSRSTTIAEMCRSYSSNADWHSESVL